MAELERIIMSNETEIYHLGLHVPGEVIKRIDELKGKYYSRNKYVLKIIDEFLDENNRLAHGERSTKK
jgi:gamma-glutamylcyclotransferase (GGCT)/AIG2-like uncharacterized protein YtfP